MINPNELIIAKKYARAFINVFGDKLNFDIINNIEEFNKLIKNNKKAFFYLELSVVNAQESKDIILKLLKKYNLKDIFDSLLDLLIKDKRLSILSLILNFIIEIYMEKSNIIEFKIISSDVLDQNQIENILKFLEIQTGKKIIYKTQIDKTMIAGIKLLSKTLGFEYSIKNQLQRLTRVY